MGEHDVIFVGHYDLVKGVDHDVPMQRAHRQRMVHTIYTQLTALNFHPVGTCTHFHHYEQMLLGPRSKLGRSVGQWHQCECSDRETVHDMMMM